MVSSNTYSAGYIITMHTVSPSKRQAASPWSSNRSKSSNRFERLERLERFELDLPSASSNQLILMLHNLIADPYFPVDETAGALA
jgi:hypothetical protein